MAGEVTRMRGGIVGIAILLAVPGMAGAAGVARDATAVALDRCLALPTNASTAGQADCEMIALRTYDSRMNVAYAALMRRLPAPAGDRLRRSQRAWLAYRDAETQTRGAVYATRQGTMYVPMEADAATTLVGDRARSLERYARMLAIE